MSARRFFVSAAVAAALASGLPASAAGADRIASDTLGIIPQPRTVMAYARTYTLPDRVTIGAASPDERNVAAFAADFLRAYGIRASVSASPRATMRFAIDARDTSLAREGYRLHVGSDGIAIDAKSGAGLYYGLQTLEQLFTPRGSATIHDVDIADAPVYPYRGMHLDVSRHFFPVSFVERYIDLAARYKLNTFHWHLTDDQGWRIAIDKYPRLTSIASCRNGTMIGHDFSSNDGVRYCGFYTKAQIRKVVAYAQRRYVTIVPEIEMPGHSVEVLAAYPQFACAPGRYAVLTIWGVSNDIVCPSEATIRFYEDVLTEVMALFPGPYIHTGGDEAPKVAWKSSPLVHAIMRRYRLRDEDAVQGWFDTRIDAFLRAHGRRMIGWDEILDGNVSRRAVVMSWRGTSGGAIAAMRGNDVIMTPDGPLYFDASQGDTAFEPLNIGGLTTLRNVYDYDPAIDGLPPAARRHVLGAQANLWTEYIPTTQQAEYMLLPRMLALAELAWTPSWKKDYGSFVARTSNQYARFDADGVAFRIPAPVGLRDTIVTAERARIALRSPVPGATMFYTIDGSLPTTTSTPYTAPFAIQLAPGASVVVRVLTVHSGERSTWASALYERTPAVPAR